MMNRSDVTVVGAGLWGCTLARRFAEAGKRVLLLEARNAIGGNVRCETDPETGIEVHSYGCHIFHSRNREVWRFVRRFTEFNGFQFHGMSMHEGRLYPLPIGLALINKFFGLELSPSQADEFMKDEGNRRAVFDAFVRGYTAKQWGCDPESVDPSVIARLPVRCNYDVNYYRDYEQGIPSDGYNVFFERLVDHPNIEIRCGEGFGLGDLRRRSESPVYYSGPLDRLFGYSEGELPWRSLRFEREVKDVADWQGTSVVYYPDADVPYTRIHEFKHFHPERAEVMNRPKTVLVREYPVQWRRGDEPFYPVNNPESEAILGAYRRRASEFRSLTVGGRLGSYRYLDMDQTIAEAMKIFEANSI